MAEDFSIRKILLVVDGTETGVRAARFAARLAALHGAALVAVAVVDTATLRSLLKSSVLVETEMAEFVAELDGSARTNLTYAEQLAREAGVAAETQVIAFDLAGVAVSAGAACSVGKVTRSHVLAAMGGADRDAQCAIRVSLGWRSTEDDVDQFVAAWRALYARAGGTTNEIKRTSVPAA